MCFFENDIIELRSSVEKKLSKKRFLHVLGVEECAAKIGERIIPESVFELRAAALLHDISKEIDIAEQLSMLSLDGFPLTDEDKTTEGIIHAFSAPIVIKRDFPDFATKNIISAVLKHTVGAEEMTVFDEIILLSDYIEKNRVFDSCVKCREFFFEKFDSLSKNELTLHLAEACIRAMDGADEALRRMNLPVNSRMKIARSFLANRILQG